jgi:hypothetical protein
LTLAAPHSYFFSRAAHASKNPELVKQQGADMNSPAQTLTSNLTVRRSTVSTEARSLAAVLASLAPIPSSSIFVGLAEDGLPVLLNLRDSSPGPVLVAADAGAGKTRLLQTVARAIELLHHQDRVRYAVVSEHPGEWSAFESSPNCEGILAFHHSLTTAYLSSLAAQGQPISGAGAFTILMLDGYEALASDGDVREAARALLRPSALGRVWPFITLNTSTAAQISDWLRAFRIRLFGYIRDQESARRLFASPDALPATLQPPYQFAAQERGGWLPFWLPELE